MGREECVVIVERILLEWRILFHIGAGRAGEIHRPTSLKRMMGRGERYLRPHRHRRGQENGQPQHACRQPDITGKSFNTLVHK